MASRTYIHRRAVVLLEFLILITNLRLAGEAKLGPKESEFFSMPAGPFAEILHSSAHKGAQVRAR